MNRNYINYNNSHDEYHSTIKEESKFTSGADVERKTIFVKKNLYFGGERGIRTLDSISTIHAFQAC